MPYTNPYKASSETGSSIIGQASGCGWLFHLVGLAFLLLACFSWFLLWDYMRPEMVKINNSYQLLGVIFVLAFFAVVPWTGYTYFYLMRISGMNGFCKIMLLVYVLPLVGSWLAAVFVYR